jgi:hypothetical protein
MNIDKENKEKRVVKEKNKMQKKASKPISDTTREIEREMER